MFSFLGLRPSDRGAATGLAEAARRTYWDYYRALAHLDLLPIGDAPRAIAPVLGMTRASRRLTPTARRAHAGTASVVRQLVSFGAVIQRRFALHRTAYADRGLTELADVSPVPCAA